MEEKSRERVALEAEAEGFVKKLTENQANALLERITSYRKEHFCPTGQCPIPVQAQ